MEETSDLLQVEGLTIQYQSGSSEAPAVNDLSFDMADGEVCGLLGESGCGKTTLALALLRMLPVSARILRGTIRYRSRNILQLPEREMRSLRGRHISLIFQDPELALNPFMRVGRQIAEVIRAHKPCSSKQCQDRAISLLEDVQLPDTRILSAYPHQLSGGQRQRVVIAQSLAAEPSLLIADEPTSAVDATTEAELMRLLRALKDRHKLAILFITHNPILLAGLADRILVMYSGRIVETGDSGQILSSPRRLHTQRLLQSLPPVPFQSRC